MSDLEDEFEVDSCASSGLTGEKSGAAPAVEAASDDGADGERLGLGMLEAEA
jgi:hypothetical protein